MKMIFKEVQNTTIEGAKKVFIECIPPLKYVEELQHKPMKDYIDSCRENLRPEYRHFLPKGTDFIKYICVSDAKTHTERLVFPAVKMDNEYQIFAFSRLAGDMTCMIEGGNPDLIFPPKKYCKELAKYNGYDEIEYIKE